MLSVNGTPSMPDQPIRRSSSQRKTNEPVKPSVVNGSGSDGFVRTTPENPVNPEPGTTAETQRWGGLKKLFGKVKEVVKKAVDIVVDFAKVVWNGEEGNNNNNNNSDTADTSIPGIFD